MDNLMPAVLVGLVGVFCIWDSRLFGRLNFEQPLVSSTIIGILLGNVEVGLAVGATVELMTMGLVHVGAALPPDMVLGGIIASAFACLTGADAETALSIAVPAAVLGQMLGVVFRSIIVALTHVADRAIDEGKFLRARQMHILYGTLLYSLMYFIPIFLAIYIGTDFVQMVVDAIPVWLSKGLSLSGKVLTAYGLALILSLMLNKGMAAFFFIGFLLVAYLGISVTAVALLAVAAAVVLSGLRYPGPTAGVLATTSDDYDPLEDDE